VRLQVQGSYSVMRFNGVVWYWCLGFAAVQQLADSASSKATGAMVLLTVADVSVGDALGFSADS
jgi:hypothetical protein